MDNTQRSVPSLFEPESRGGDVAEGGFAFQESIILSWIPKWLSVDGFESMIREATGDTEARFFVPGRGYVVEFIEVKNHLVTPAEFWSEVERFRRVDAGSPGTYAWFTIACNGLSEALRPLVNGLRRIRGPYGFYDEAHGILANSMIDYLRLVTESGHSEAEGQFLFEKVLVLPECGTAARDGEALFRQAMSDHLPWATDSNRVLGAMYRNLSALVGNCRNQVIHRRQLEEALMGACPDSSPWADREITLYTDAGGGSVPQTALVLRWSEFFGGSNRQYPDTSAWNDQLLAGLAATQDWIRLNRRERTVRLTGDRRLSGAVAVGAIFSAVAGYGLRMEARGRLWTSDAYATAGTEPYELDVQRVLSRGSELVATVGIVRSISAEVTQFLAGRDLGHLPVIHFFGRHGIASSDQADLAVREMKLGIAEALRTTGATRIHLFFAGPSFLAMLLGHRLNATCSVQCYEWVGPSTNAPTCTLATC